MDFRKKTFSTINSSGDISIIDVPERHKDMSRSLTDRTNYVSDAEAIKRLTLQGSQPLTSPQLKAFYDFADGKDNGMRVPVTRIKGLDISEVSTQIKEETKELTEKIKKEQKKKALYESLSDSVTSNSSSSSNDSTVSTSTSNNA